MKLILQLVKNTHTLVSFYSDDDDDDDDATTDKFKMQQLFNEWLIWKFVIKLKDHVIFRT